MAAYQKAMAKVVEIKTSVGCTVAAEMRFEAEIAPTMAALEYIIEPPGKNTPSETAPIKATT